MDVADFGELKYSLVRVTGIVLMILFLEHAVSSRPSEHILGFGIAIAAVISAAAWGISQESRGLSYKHKTK